MSYRKTFGRTVRADYKGRIHVNYRPGKQNEDPTILVEYDGEQRKHLSVQVIFTSTIMQKRM